MAGGLQQPSENLPHIRIIIHHSDGADHEDLASFTGHLILFGHAEANHVDLAQNRKLPSKQSWPAQAGRSQPAQIALAAGGAGQAHQQAAPRH